MHVEYKESRTESYWNLVQYNVQMIQCCLLVCGCVRAVNQESTASSASQLPTIATELRMAKAQKSLLLQHGES